MKQLDTLISNGESDTLEFKRSTAKLKNAAQSLCGFLNGQGGTVLIGVSNTGKLIGQTITDNTKLEIANVLAKFEPSAHIDINYHKLKTNKHIIALTAKPDERCTPYTYDGRPYERIQSSTRRMPHNRHHDLIIDRYYDPTEWEQRIAKNVTIEDLDHDEIISTVEEGRRCKHIDTPLDTKDISGILKRFKLLTHNQINNAAVVLFAKDPAEFMSQCTLRLARFKGLEKGHFIDSALITGNAFELLRQAHTFIHRNTAVECFLEEGNWARTDIPEYPYKAVREAIINALCHRDYVFHGGRVTIAIYDDRIEINSMGLLMKGITWKELQHAHPSLPRNPNILNAFYRRGYIESMGTGTQLIAKECQAANMQPPEFFKQSGTFVVRLWSKHYKHFNHIQNLTNKQLEILEAIRIEGALTTQELFVALNSSIPRRSLQRELQKLKDKDLVEHLGSGPNSKWQNRR